MTLTAFDHVNIHTNNLDTMIDWYGDILGLRSGKRPNFAFPGAWMYLGDRAVVHLVDWTDTMQAGGDVTLEHFAFRATDMPAFLEKLSDRGIDYSIDPVPDFPIVQVNLFDPDGNHIHIDFDSTKHLA
jgi:catechol 2,3-dioxygenase-like lactoylglutathione lyase family enzyme